MFWDILGWGAFVEKLPRLRGELCQLIVLPFVARTKKSSKTRVFRCVVEKLTCDLADFGHYDVAPWVPNYIPNKKV